MMLVSGIFNVLVSAGILIGLLLSVVGLCVAPIWLLTLVGGVVEIAMGVGVMQGSPRPSALPVSVVGLVSAVLCGNMLGMILEILAMVYLGKPEVAGWLADPHGRPALPPPGPRPPVADAASPAPGRPPPADFPPTPIHKAGPSVSRTGDLPLVQKG
jgi:hypothetical protein